MLSTVSARQVLTQQDPRDYGGKILLNQPPLLHRVCLPLSKQRGPQPLWGDWEGPHESGAGVSLVPASHMCKLSLRSKCLTCKMPVLLAESYEKL